MNQRDIEELVRQTTWPTPSPDLRSRVLSAAVVVGQPITWSDRMWFSRAWRLAALGAAVVIVMLDQFTGTPRSAAVAPTAQAMAEARAVEAIGRQAGLPPDVAASIADRALAEASTSRMSSPSPAAVLQALDVDGTGGRR